MNWKNWEWVKKEGGVFMKKEFLNRLFKNISSELEKMKQEYKDLYEKYFKAKPNALLGEIPLFVISTNFSQENEVTGYKSYLKDDFNENMFVNPYTIQVECLIFGSKWKSELEKIMEFSKERKYTAFMYEKLENKVYGPLALTNFSYTEDWQAYTGIKVSLTLKQVNLLEFTKDENGVITTNVYSPNSTLQNREMEPISLNEVLHDKYNNDSRTQGVV